MTCPNGHDVPPSARFCPVCGAPTVTLTVAAPEAIPVVAEQSPGSLKTLKASGQRRLSRKATWGVVVVAALIAVGGALGIVASLNGGGGSPTVSPSSAPTAGEILGLSPTGCQVVRIVDDMDVSATDPMCVSGAIIVKVCDVSADAIFIVGRESSAGEGTEEAPLSARYSYAAEDGSPVYLDRIIHLSGEGPTETVTCPNGKIISLPTDTMGYFSGIATGELTAMWAKPWQDWHFDGEDYAESETSSPDVEAPPSGQTPEAPSGAGAGTPEEASTTFLTSMVEVPYGTPVNGTAQAAIDYGSQASLGETYEFESCASDPTDPSVYSESERYCMFVGQSTTLQLFVTKKPDEGWLVVNVWGGSIEPE